VPGILLNEFGYSRPAWTEIVSNRRDLSYPERRLEFEKNGLAILLALVVVLFVVGIAIYFLTIYNSLVRLKNDINKSWSNIDVLLKQRHDELPKLIETCKGYMQYEQKTFQMIAEARTAFMHAGSVAQKAQATT